LNKADHSRLIESLSRDNEEKVYQMSMVSTVAELMASGLHRTDYFDRICTDFVRIFNASICAVFWFRHREPSGWWLDAWHAASKALSPSAEDIPVGIEGLLGWSRDHDKPVYLEDSIDEEILSFWGLDPQKPATLILLPVTLENEKTGIIVLINPVILLSGKNSARLVNILCSLVKSGCHNRLLYKNLYDSKEEVQDLFENSSDMVVVVYPDGIIRDCNRTFVENLRFKFNPVGSRLIDLIKKDRAEDFFKCWSQLLNGQEVQNVDVTLEKDDGSAMEIELSGNVRMLPDGRIGIIRLYLRDVTDKRRMEHKKAELELKMKLMRQRELAQIGLYVSGIAHNLRNPIHVIKGHLELMNLKGQDQPEMEIIGEYVNNLNEIIENLMDKVHYERNINVIDIDLNDLLQRELNFLKANLFFQHEVEKDLVFGDKLPMIKGVYSDFSQAIMNVVYNALDAMMQSNVKKLGVTTEYDEESREIRISISDTGDGIPEENRDKVFEPFFTTKDAEEEDKYGLTCGSGIGLSSSLSLLEPYNGSINFTSTPGKGTTFYITFKVR